MDERSGEFAIKICNSKDNKEVDLEKLKESWKKIAKDLSKNESKTQELVKAIEGLESIVIAYHKDGSQIEEDINDNLTYQVVKIADEEENQFLNNSSRSKLLNKFQNEEIEMQSMKYQTLQIKLPYGTPSSSKPN